MNILKKDTLDNNVKNILNTEDSFEYEYISNNVEETKLLGENFGKYIQKGDIIILNGELGSGKTVFLSGLARYFGIETQVCSPTFTIVNEYDPSNGPTIFHFDVYRIKDSNDFMEGVGTDYFYLGASIIEWGDEIIPDIIPEYAIHIDISKSEDDTEKRIFKIWRK